MGYGLPIDEEVMAEQKLRSIAFMNHVIADFETLREDPIAWQQYCDDFEAIDGVRPK